MQTKSKIFAAGRIRVLEKGLIRASDMQRLCESDYDGAVRLLSEWGYGGEHSASPDFEKRIEGELIKAKDLMIELSSEPMLTNAILLRYDVANLKTLLKIYLKDKEAFSQKVDFEALSCLGLIEPKLMQLMVAQQDYPEIPENIANAAINLQFYEDKKPSPQEASVIIDRAYYEYVLSLKNPIIHEYFKAECDFSNILALLRLTLIYKEDTSSLKNTLEAVLMPQGEVKKENLLSACDHIAADFKKAKEILLADISAELYEVLSPLISEDMKLYLIEKAKDDYLIEIARKGKSDMETIAAVLGYFWARLREAECIRLIMTLKRNDVPANEILERLSEVYG